MDFGVIMHTSAKPSRQCVEARVVGRDGALVESITFNRRVVGSTPALAVT